MTYAHTLAFSAPDPPSRQLLTHASIGDSWTHPGKSGSVSCGDTALFSDSMLTH